MDGTVQQFVNPFEVCTIFLPTCSEYRIVDRKKPSSKYVFESQNVLGARHCESKVVDHSSSLLAHTHLDAETFGEGS